jgi:hypothetical protein
MICRRFFEKDHMSIKQYKRFVGVFIIGLVTAPTISIAFNARGVTKTGKAVP